MTDRPSATTATAHPSGSPHWLELPATFTTLIESVTHTVTLIDASGIICGFNAAAAQEIKTVFGRTLQVGDPIARYVLPRDRANFAHNFARALAGERVRTVLPFVDADGDTRWFEFVYAPVVQPDGTVPGICFTVSNITERQQAATTIGQLSRQNQLLLDAVSDGIIGIDREGKCLYLNRAARDLLHTTAAAAIGQHFYARYHWPTEHDFPQAWEASALYAALRDGQPHRANAERYRGDNGMAIFVDTVSTPMLEEGAVVGAVITLRDVSAQLAAAQALRKSEERFRSVVEHAHEGIVLTDEQGAVVVWNAAMTQITGIPTEQALGRAIWELWFELELPEERAEARHATTVALARAALATGQGPWLGQTSERKYRRSNGDIGISATTAFVAPTRDGFALGGFLRDVTEARRTQVALEARNRTLTTLFHISAILLTDQPLARIYDAVMQAVFDATGATVGEIELLAPARGSVGTQQFRAQHATAAPVIAAASRPILTTAQQQAVIQNAQPQVWYPADAPAQIIVAAPMQLHDHTLGILALAHPDRLAAPDDLVNLLQNVANHLALAIENRRTTEDLHERAQQMNCLYQVTRILQTAQMDMAPVLEEIVALLPVGFRSSAGVHARIEVDSFVTRTAPIGAARGQLVAPLVVDGTPRGTVVVWRTETSTETSTEISTEISTNSGAGAEAAFLPEELALLEEIARRLSLYIERLDTTAQLLAEQANLEARVVERTAQLAAANAELAKAARMKDEFLASMSHELRTPLTGILGLSEALQMAASGPLTERQLRSIQLIESSGRHLLELINDILDVAKIEAGKIQLQTDVVPVDALCQAAVQMVREIAAAKQQQIAIAVAAPNLIIHADRRRLKQMLVNLLSNAVKFTDDGGRLGIEVTTDAAAEMMQFVVWDTGIGIAAESIPQLFQPFVQLDSSLARQYAGTGLGLALVQRIATLHGGAVSVASTVGAGSRFTITLPWTPPARPLAALPPIADVATLPETQQTSRLRLLARLLRRFGAIPLPQALTAQTFDQIARTQPEIVLLGAGDLDATGAPLWQVLHSDPRTQPVHLLVADLAESDPLADASLVHPLPGFFTVGDLSAAFRQTGLHGSRPRVAIIGAPPLRPRVLVTEDSEATQLLLQDFLASFDYEVLLATDGAAAVNLAATARPDVILMDVQMPGVDGLEATRRIRALADGQASQTPIIAVTALAMPGDAERCQAAGVDSYLTKPFALQDVVQKIEEWLVVRIPDKVILSAANLAASSEQDSSLRSE